MKLSNKLRADGKPSLWKDSIQKRPAEVFCKNKNTLKNLANFTENSCVCVGVCLLKRCS